MNTAYNANEFGLDFGKRHINSPVLFPLAPSLGILVPSHIEVTVTPRDRRGVEADTDVS